MKSAMQDMADSLEMWGVREVYRLGLAVQATKCEEIPDRIRQKILRKTESLARKIQRNAGGRGYNGRARKWFYLMRLAHRHFPPSEPDHGYWEERGWHGRARPWRDD